jgi:Na+-driven multidrug efflux pump
VQDFVKHAGLFMFMVFFGGLGVACWPLVPKSVGSNTGEAVEFVTGKITSAGLPSEGK